MKVKIRLGVIDVVAIILWIVATVERPCAFTEATVDIARFLLRLVFSHQENVRLDIVLVESSCLTHEALNCTSMILRQHGRDRVPLGREIKQREIILLRWDAPVAVVDRRILIFEWISYQLKILESKGSAEIELVLGIGIGRVPVIDLGAKYPRLPRPALYRRYLWPNTWQT